jgi:hypothetical protein
VDVLVAGALVGAIMGMVTQAYWMIVLAFKPPALINNESALSRIGNLILLGGVLLIGGWILFAALLGLAFNAVRPDQADAPLVPSFGFLLVIFFISTFALIPLTVFLRSYLKHVLLTYLLFLGLCGFLLPNLVVAVQD